MSTDDELAHLRDARKQELVLERGANDGGVSQKKKKIRLPRKTAQLLIAMDEDIGWQEAATSENGVTKNRHVLY